MEVIVEGSPPNGPVLIVANHRSYLDIAVMLSATPCVFLAKQEVRSWPVLGYGARMIGTLFVKRESENSRRSSRRAITSALLKGHPVAVFPEGTTTDKPGTAPFRQGAFEAAAAAGRPVTPVAIAYQDSRAVFIGDDGFIEHFLRCFREGRLKARICFGPGLEGGDGAELCERARDWINHKLIEIENRRMTEGTNEENEKISIGVLIPAGTAAPREGIAISS